MLTQQAVRDECFSTTYSRARAIMKESYMVQDRRVEYGRYTNLDAFVESSMGDDGYDASVTLDEARDKVVDYYCTCPAHRKYPGMCKHAGAVALLFLDKPHTFQGYKGQTQAQTSPSLSRLLAKSLPSANLRAYDPEKSVPQGTLSLEMTLEEAYGGLTARFKLVSLHASYVIKGISDFLRLLENREYFEYGKKLAFTHDITLFTPQAQDVIRVLKRLVAPDETRTRYGKSYQFGSAHVGRDLVLGQLDAIELLDAYGSVPFLYDDGKRFGASPEIARISAGNPPLKLRIQPFEDGYEILRDDSLNVIAFDERAYVIINHVFYRCTKDFAPCAEFLRDVYCSWDDRLTIAESDLPAFCASLLPQLQECLHIEAPQELEALKPVPCKIEFYLDKPDDNCVCRIKALYGLQSFNPLQAATPENRAGRDIAAEAAACNTALRFLPLQTPEGTACTQTVDEAAALVFQGLSELKLIGEVFTTPAFDRMVVTTPPRIQVGVSLVGNLINMKTQVSDLPPEELSALLESYRKRKHYHRLSDGSLLSLAGTAGADMGLDQLETLYTGLNLTEKQLMAQDLDLPLYQAFLLDAELEEQSKDTSFKAFIESFDAGQVANHSIPRALAGVLRPYQKEGFKWLNLLLDLGLGGILADEMGLGKSLQVISALLHRRKDLAGSPALIVCPASLVYNWQAEFAKFAPSLRVEAVAGSKESRQLARGNSKTEVLITSYDSLRIDIEDWKSRAFFACIIDEAQYIKNHATQVARCVKKIDAQHRLALTGTPIENRLSELWSIFDFLMPSMLGSYNRFKERYELPIVGGNEQASERLRHLVGPFILRRCKKDVLKDLPDKLEQVISCRMDDEQRKLYDAHEQRLRQQIEGQQEDEISQGKIAILAELTHLRQICCDPRLLYENYSDAGVKMEAMLDLIAAAEDSGQKVLLFSQFTSFLDLVAKELRHRKLAYYTITGKTPKKQRVMLVDRFNQDSTPVFLISLKAGGTGLNLTGASVVIHADPWWNEAAQRQATDRAHRIGQQQTVTVYQVIAQNTIEERILKLQQSKRDLADQVLDAQGASLGSLSREDLVALLSEG